MNKLLWRLFLVSWLLLFVAMGLRTHTAVSDIFVVHFSFLVYYLFALLAGSALLLWVTDNYKTNKAMLLSWFAFAFYVCLVFVFQRERLYFETIGLMVSWPFFVLVLSTIWAEAARFRGLLFATILGSLIVVLWGSASYVLFGFDIDKFEGRWAFGYENPNYFSQYVVVLVFAIGFYLVERKERKISPLSTRLAIPIVGLSLLVVVLANSRNAMVALSVFYLNYYVTNVKAKSILISFVMILGLVSATGQDLNEVSSGRLALWDQRATYALNESPISVWFGVKEYPRELLPRYSRLRELGVSGPEKLRMDNAYLEIILDLGIVGFLMLLCITARIWHRSSYVACEKARIWRSAVSAVLCQALFVPALFSFFAPVPLFLIVIWALPHYYYRGDTNLEMRLRAGTTSRTRYRMFKNSP